MYDSHEAWTVTSWMTRNRVPGLLPPDKGHDGETLDDHDEALDGYPLHELCAKDDGARTNSLVRVDVGIPSSLHFVVTYFFVGTC